MYWFFYFLLYILFFPVLLRYNGPTLYKFKVYSAVTQLTNTVK